MRACHIESKLLRGFSGTKLNRPPNTCMPSNANITMSRNSSSSKLAIELILLSNEFTRLRSGAQYLGKKVIFCNHSYKNFSTPAHCLKRTLNSILMIIPKPGKQVFSIKIFYV